MYALAIEMGKPWSNIHRQPIACSSRMFSKCLTDAQWAEMVQRGQRETLQPKRTLFLQGDPAERFYLVNRGRLKLSRLSELGKEAIIRYLGAGEMAAAVVVLKGRDYPVTAEAVEETDVISFLATGSFQ
jgi:CRP-like cAMP-binding protein